MNCDVAHKAMRTDTVLDLLTRCRREDANNFENSFRQKVLGITVLANYSNKTHRIDDVDFNITPASTFTRNGAEISIQQYYKDVRVLAEFNLVVFSAVNLFCCFFLFAQKYKLEIINPTQPLLISNPRARDLRGGEQRPAWLVPELCYITGLDEQQRNNME